MGYRVLIADDSEMTRLIIRRNFELSGLECDMLEDADNGVQAWALLQEKDFDLAILDISMPGLTGLQVLQKMHDHQMLNHTNILIISSHRNEKTIEEFLHMGAKGFLPKPFTPEEMIAAVKVAVGFFKDGNS
jgi:two-component system chemotaxis response regulator CheY